MAVEMMPLEPRRGTTRVLIVQPRFSAASFWDFREVCHSVGAKYPSPPLGLITVAAMLPSNWEVRLVDCNARALDDDQIDWADLILSGGMLPQQVNLLALVDRCRAR